ncbi:hypothetical protein IIV30_002R [Invertebrate iridescent virus 30]|uniref:Nicotinamide mononucleotide transporter n=1 Tax=Invertebrate iridescent virus 30 TaxID=345585 RepID=W8W1N3_9VIRU|nr:hypothetical protein IIV30_002R [Invertebrate iridescent virus 30]CCV02197.1 hypothetical protein IIV30_002R [Invertebrate iridescent virus 30]
MTEDIEIVCETSKFTGESKPTKNILWKTYSFWIETAIFIISVVGAICISYQQLQGFLLWFISNIISIIYFAFKKQYPLTLQQIVFLITTILGIVYNYDKIF